MDDLTDHEDCGLDHGAKAYHELEAEVERLRAERDAFEDDMKTNLATAEKALAEVERLRSHLCPNPYMGVHAEADLQREAEVEQLRKLLDEYATAGQNHANEVVRLRAALEKIANGGYEGRGDNSLSPGGVTRFTYTKKGLRAIAALALAEEKE